ncbi:MAG TPA: GNAT family N-acetyltransferase [Anaerolineaceae bacterium]|nr:GNAT family N-acetyltransferase [Anaerolineaceae bacterium]
MIRDERPAAVLALPPDPPGVYWIRAFACSAQFKPGEVFSALLEQAICQLETLPGKKLIASLAMQNWFNNILLKNGFEYHQDIVVLTWEDQPVRETSLPAGFQVRPLIPPDLPAVAQLDQRCFEDIWQLSLDSLHHAFGQSAYSTVVEVNRRIVAYQISTESGVSAHLARIAVDPDWQGKGIGLHLLLDMLRFFTGQGHTYITVNTQSNNQASLALYQAAGFTRTQEAYPVLLRPWR